MSLANPCPWTKRGDARDEEGWLNCAIDRVACRGGSGER
jgi:hypothetical protein